MAVEIKPYWQNYIDGKFVDGGAGKLVVDNPGTGEKLAEQAIADANDVDHAVQAASRVHQSGELSGLRPVERGRMVQAMGRYLLDNIDEISEVLCLESGKPLWEAHVEIEGAARYFEYYGNQAETMEGRSIPLGANYFDFTVYEPYGVSAQIIPWNYPMEMTARSLSAALATGNTCVIKTPELDPLTNYYFAKAAEAAGLPTGAVNIFCGYGHEAGAALSAHPLVNQIVFTGSVPTGIAIATAAAQNVVPCVLELGGKSAAIVHDDADIDAAVEGAIASKFRNAGQTCVCSNRVFAQAGIYDEFVQKLSIAISKLKIGDGLEEGINIGPMITSKAVDFVEKVVKNAREGGASILTGGKVSTNNSLLYEPTLITHPSTEMMLFHEEIFGPVAPVFAFQTEEEVIELANNTQYGLASYFYGRDYARIWRVAEALEYGMVGINTGMISTTVAPFGGIKESGIGREGSKYGIEEFVNMKYMCWGGVE